MRYVLDASVGLKCVLAESDSDRALALQDEFQRGRHELHAPDTFPIEVAHALTRAERRGIIAPPEARMKLADMLAAAPILHSYLPLLGRAVEISSQLRIGVYDCLYVALAEREACELITSDQRLANAIQPTHPGVVLLSTL